MSPNKGPFQKEFHLPTVDFQGDMLVFGGVLLEEDDAPGSNRVSPARSDFS